ncbi:TPA: hypothetical protein ACGUWU_004383, partial [Vibrio vulnificus]
HMIQWRDGGRDTTALFAALGNVVSDLIAQNRIVASTNEGCTYQFTDGVCVIDSQGNYTSKFMKIINYTIGWIPPFWAEAKEVAKQFDTNFLQKHEGKAYLGKDFDMLKSFTVGTDFELRKYQEAKMLEKLPHYYR